MCNGCAEHVPSCICGGQHSQEGPNTEVVDGGQEDDYQRDSTKNYRPCPLVVMRV